MEEYLQRGSWSMIIRPAIGLLCNFVVQVYHLNYE